MPIYLKQSTASQELPLGYFVSSTDGDTAMTGLTIANTDIKLWVNGATTLANKNSGGATHIANGVYYCVLDATDTATIGPLVIYCKVATALAIRVECVVLAANVYDVLFGTTAISTYAGGAVASVSGNVGGSVASVTGAVGSVTGNVGGNVAGSVGSVTGNVGGNVAGSVASVTAGVTVSTNNDKTGYALAANQHVIVDSGTVGTVTNPVDISTGSGAALVAAVAAAVTSDHGSGSYVRNTEPDNASVVQCRRAVYDSLTASGDTLILSDGTTQTIDADGNRTTAGP